MFRYYFYMLVVTTMLHGAEREIPLPNATPPREMMSPSSRVRGFVLAPTVTRRDPSVPTSKSEVIAVASSYIRRSIDDKTKSAPSLPCSQESPFSWRNVSLSASLDNAQSFMPTYVHEAGQLVDGYLLEDEKGSSESDAEDSDNVDEDYFETPSIDIGTDEDDGCFFK